MINVLAEDLRHILTHTEPLWDNMRKARIFITGGTGFFGCWLLESLVSANDKFDLDASVLVLTRNPDAFLAKAPHLATHHAVHLVQGDMQTFKFPKGDFSHIIHAAVETDSKPKGQDPVSIYNGNVEGIKRILEFSRVCSAGRFLLTSSGAVYGRQPSEVTHISEDYSGAPETTDMGTAYGHAKRVSEFMCAAHSRRFGFEVVIARCFAFVGPYLPLNAGYAITDFIRDALHGSAICVNGDATPYRSYLYAADLAIWLWTILLRGKPLRPYNVGSDEGITIRELADRVASNFCPKPIVNVAQEASPGKQPERYVPSIDRATTELGLKPIIGLNEAIRKTVLWHSRTCRGNTRVQTENIRPFYGSNDNASAVGSYSITKSPRDT